MFNSTIKTLLFIYSQFNPDRPKHQTRHFLLHHCLLQQVQHHIVGKLETKTGRKINIIIDIRKISDQVITIEEAPEI